ncbi:MAG: glycoside hydrolase family 88 protein [Pseudomonadota bacterium]
MPPLHTTLMRAAALFILATSLPGQPCFAQGARAIASAPFSDAFAPKAVLEVMQQVANWQLANPSGHPATDWTQAVGDTGMMALAGISGQASYRDAMLAMGEKNGWKLGPNRYHADDQIVGQTYAELYLQLREPKMIAAMRAQFDELLANPHEGPLLFTVKGNQDRWSWCDALFMAPPAWARLYAATGEQRYLDLAVNHWWRTSDYLYDKEEHLYFRDSNYFERREANGQKVYWSRGNGWVMGGLVRMLQYLPSNHPARARFEQQFKQMAARLVTLQQDDGMWRASLLDPASYPMRETSGTGLYTYAFAWGVNQGLLERARFEPAARRAWSALVVSVQADGKLTHVQPIGLAPKAFDENATEVYGVGAFLLAGSEMYRMALQEQARPRLVTVRNPADFHRADELVQLAPGAASAVMDGATSRILTSQLQDHRLLFQATLAPGETRSYLLFDAAQLPALPPPDVKAHARFVPERLDDFAWENDRIAHRMYGPAIMHDPKEKLVSSGVDVWVKSVRSPVIDKWYKAGDYHQDHGEGLDFYSVGNGRGCGGLGIFDGKALYNPANFSSWKVLADGPLRAQFELSFDAWDAGGRKVSELRRITLDAGSSFSRVESRFSGTRPLLLGVGITERKGDGHYTQERVAGSMSYWEPQHGADGSIACAVIVGAGASFAEHAGQYLALARVRPPKVFTYYLGAGWSKGDFADANAWDAYVRRFSQGLAAPLVIR